MKNILGNTENLQLFNKEGELVYQYHKSSTGYSYEYTRDSNGKILTYKDSEGNSWEKTYDSNGNELTYRRSDGYSSEYTYNSNGNELTYKDSNGYSSEYTYDLNGNTLTYKNSTGFSFESTYDSDGKELTFKDSNGVTRGFGIPKEEPKQETLEEAADTYSKKSSASMFQENHKKDFIAGAEWHAERRYSEEDMKQAFLDGMFCFSGETVDEAIEEWFEQFKK